jgi:hypothetical protein
VSELPTADEVYECGHAGIDFLQKWMRTPNPQFGGAIPLQLMLIGQGHKVAQYIQDAYEFSKPPLACSCDTSHACSGDRQ